MFLGNHCYIYIKIMKFFSKDIPTLHVCNLNKEHFPKVKMVGFYRKYQLGRHKFEGREGAYSIIFLIKIDAY